MAVVMTNKEMHKCFANQICVEMVKTVLMKAIINLININVLRFYFQNMNGKVVCAAVIVGLATSLHATEKSTQPIKICDLSAIIRC